MTKRDGKRVEDTGGEKWQQGHKERELNKAGREGSREGTEGGQVGVEAGGREGFREPSRRPWAGCTVCKC